MKKIIFAVFICFISIFSISFYSSSSSKNESISKENLLFILSGKDGHIKKENNHYTVTIYDVDNTITFFTDRPQRKAGKISTKKFFDGWFQSFKTAPPNAAIVFHAGKKSFSEIAIELTKPIYDQFHSRLTFTAQTLDSKDHISEGNTGEIALFIDDMPSNAQILM